MIDNFLYKGEILFMLTWHYVTSTAYKAANASEKTSDKLYFLSDTHEIYRGTELFTQACEVYSTLPTAPAVGRLYIDSTTLEGKIYNGSAWTTVIQPVQAALTASDTAKPVSGKAVADYVADEIAKVTGSGELVKSLSYAADTNKFTVTMADNTTDEIEMTGVAADLVYDAQSGKLQVKNAAGTAIGTGINLDLERFVSDASYDPETHKITLNFNDSKNPLEIDVGDLVDTYTAENSTTVSLTVTGNKFVAEAIVASDASHADNLLVKTANGLYVAPVDLSGKMDLAVPASAGAVATLNASGQATDSGKSIGGATLAAVPSASVLATEAAVEAIRSSLQTAIDGKIAKMGTGNADEIVTSTADGQVKRSGVKAGGEALNASPDAATLATEKAVKDAIDALKVGDKQDKDKDAVEGNLAKFDAHGNSVDAGVVAGGAALAASTSAAASSTTLATEKAVVAALEWKTTV